MSKDPFASISREDLLACLAEGQAAVMDYFHATLNIQHEAKLHGESGRKRASEAYDAAMTKLMKWAMHRDDVRKKPHPLEAAWDFRLRAYDSQRESVIKQLEEAIAGLKSQRPSAFEAPKTNVPSGFKSPTPSPSGIGQPPGKSRKASATQKPRSA